MTADNNVDNNYASTWSIQQEKAFENSVAVHSEDSDDFFEKITSDVPGKSLEEIKHHYELLVDDVGRIESGCVPLPNYISSSDGSTNHSGDSGTSKKGSHSGNLNTDQGSKVSKAEQERRKGIAWTEDEHRLFLLGLDKYGKGDWRSISRNFVVTRTPTQVASHAQKYFIRLNSINKDRRRTSIHDITSVNNSEVSVPQGPITGQTNSPTPVGKPGKQQPSNLPVGGMYGTTTIGQPIGSGPLISAVGTPVNPQHMIYGTVVPGGPMNAGPMPHTSSHR
ncbi:transcription factor SRM1-like [Impatiens glandulifera]|uniref:transcription factor SRM1-like n=1 Tax=Impatiens glandulifera TaxID=253017 RepID=UPI001FB196FF|nr:transcription factor SRM1-like [Impatiens glandulifera]XP_047341724.1 transcription factor SRM1-like [Impatiens glandulifera]XP_047341725.1 transcription factor SRM1-like [Impatiens glandulifera]